MAIPNSVTSMVGVWRGESLLNLSESPDELKLFESESTLTVESDPNGAFAVVRYTWAHDGVAQYGCIVLAGDENSDSLTGAWTDSFHQATAMMPLTGTGFESGELDIKGNYTFPEYGDWGWRIVLSRSSASLLLTMFNIEPSGEETWAVKAVYAST